MAKKPPSEKETRSRLMSWARQYGCEAQLMKIFARYDDLLKGCKTEEDRKAIQAMGVIEVHEFFAGASKDDNSTLTIDGVRVK